MNFFLAILLFLLPIVVRRYFIPVQIAVAIVWLFTAIVRTPMESSAAMVYMNSLNEFELLFMPFWITGSLVALAIQMKQLKR